MSFIAFLWSFKNFLGHLVALLSQVAKIDDGYVYIFLKGHLQSLVLSQLQTLHIRRDWAIAPT